MRIENIKTVVYDLDDTLYDFLSLNPAAYEKLVKKAAELTGVSEEAFSKAFDPTYRELSESMTKGFHAGPAHSRMIRLGLALEKLDQKPFPAMRILYDTYWNDILEKMQPRPGIKETMQELKQRGIRIGIGTNMTIGMQYRKIETLGLGEYIDFLLASEETIVDKPHPRFFDAVAEKAHCDRDEILFIGDNKNHDYTPARAAGMSSLWYRPDLSLSIGTEEEGDQIIYDHREIFTKEWI